MLMRNKYFLILALTLIMVGAIFLFFLTKPESKDTSKNQEIISLDEKKEINVKVVIDTGSDKYEYVGTLNGGATVFDLLKKTSAVNNFSFDYKESGLGIFVEEIYGVKNNSMQNKFWLYKINGDLATIGASAQKIQDGDIVEWFFGDTSSYFKN